MSIVSVSQVNVITFRKRELKALFHSLSSYSLYCSPSPPKTFSTVFLRESSHLCDFQTQKVWSFYSLRLFALLYCYYKCLGLFMFMHFLCSSLFLRISSFFPLFWISRVGRRLLRVSFPFFAINLFTKPFLFFVLHLLRQSMAHTKTTANPPPSGINYKIQYPWASDELLVECTTLTTVGDVEDHMGDPRLYNFNAFYSVHDSHVFVRHDTPGEPVCVDDRSNGGKPFFFLYQTVFKRVGLRLPFTAFERELLTEISTAPDKLHPNSWAFIRAFEILCRYLGILPSVDVFFHFFEVKKQGKSLWVSFSGVFGRILLTLFQNSYKGWKGKFFRVCCTKRDPTALDDFPLYWMEEPKLIKPKSLDELPSVDREVCVALAGLGIVFSTVKLIACEFNASALSTYFGRKIYTPTCLLYICLLMCFL